MGIFLGKTRDGFTLSHQLPHNYGQRLKVCGNHPALGNRDAAEAPYMEYNQDGEWSLSIAVDSKAAASLNTIMFLKNRVSIPGNGEKKKKAVDPRSPQGCQHPRLLAPRRKS
ncbi:MAG: carbohydrate-binding module family 20 domain-containing protein [Bacteroidia bacterium]